MQFQHKRPYQEIGLILRSQLVAGKYQIGDRLPPEREIALQLDVSRAIVREAIIMLELENLVEVRKGAGVFVVALPGTPQAAEAESLTQHSGGPFEMLQVRQLLESSLAEFAAVQVTPSDVVKMREALEMERRELARGAEQSLGDENFHLAIAEATHNSLMVELFKQSWAWRENNPMWQQLHKRISNQEYRKEWLDDHRQILAAMIKKDALAAKRAMWQHLENVKQRLMELSDVDDPNFDGYLFCSVPVVYQGEKTKDPV